MLDNGVNVAVPFYDKQTMRGCLVEEWHGWEAINGDESDLRFNDPKGVIVALKAKLPKSRKKAIAKIKKNRGFFVGV